MVNKIAHSNAGKVKLTTIKLSTKPIVSTRFSRELSEADKLKFAQDFKAWEVGNSLASDTPATSTDVHIPRNKVLSFTFAPFKTIQISTRGGDFFVERVIDQKKQDGSPKFNIDGEFVIFDPRGNDKYANLFPKRMFDLSEPISYRALFPERPFMIHTTSTYKNETGGEVTEKRNDFGIMYLGNNNFKIIATSPDLISLRITQSDIAISASEISGIKNENASTLRTMLESFELRKKHLPNNVRAFYAVVDIKGKIRSFVRFDGIEMFRSQKKNLTGQTSEISILAKYNVQQMSGKALGKDKSYEQIRLSDDPFINTDGLGENPIKMIRSILELSATKVNAELANKDLK